MAERGQVDAQFELGRLYIDDKGVAQDYASAMVWFRKAADQGLAYAQDRLRLMYETGLGVSVDYAEAVKWYRKAADQGDKAAQSKLAVAYENGTGVERDYVEAYMWWSLSTGIFPGPKTMLMDLTADGVHSVDQVMTPGQIEDAQKLVREWKPQK